MSKCNQYRFCVDIVKNGVIVRPAYDIRNDVLASAEDTLVFGDLTDFLDWARSIFPEET